MIFYLLGEVVVVKVLDLIYEKIEEIEEEYRVFYDFGNYFNIFRFYGIYFKLFIIDVEVWIVMEVSYWDDWNLFLDGKIIINLLFV